MTPTYDSKGNLTSGGGATYAYSSENLLTSASGGITLAYDPMLRLYETAGGSGGTRRYAYDGQDLIAEYNSSNAMLRRYVHEPGSDEPLVWYEGSGTSDRRFLHSDERGSVIATSNSSGATLSTNAYDEYGIPKSTNTGRFQYTGQTWLPELGMYYYKARLYSPTLGRFLQTDPIGYGDGMNLYAYVGGDPVNRRDPSGMCYLVDVGYSWWTTSGEYAGPAPGSYFVLRGCESGFWDGLSDVGGGVDGSSGGGTGGPEENPCEARLPDGSTINRNVDQVKKWKSDAAWLILVHPVVSMGYAYAKWFDKVRPGGAWDYKLYDPDIKVWAAEGNMNYGATGIQLLPLDILLRGAATVQDPASKGDGHWTDPSGSSDYGDEPSDIPYIKEGAARCKGTR